MQGTVLGSARSIDGGGVHNWWLVATWSGAFVLMMRHVGSISAALQKHDTLHSFLGTEYRSGVLQRMAGVITMASGIGIIALEIIVVMALLVPVAGTASPVLPLIAGFAVLVTLALYSVLGGFTAVTDTDKYQLKGVLIGLVCVAIVMVRAIAAGIAPMQNVQSAFTPTFAASGTSPVWFFAGLFFLQVPLFLGDFGTWQRIKACAPETVPGQRRTFGRLGIINAVAWIILVGAGIVLSSIPSGIIPSYSDSFLYATAAPIVNVISLAMLPGQFGGALLGISLVFLITIGLLCAMMSTADSYLLISMQALDQDVVKASGRSDTPGNRGMRFAQSYCLAAVFIAFVIAVYVVTTQANFLPIISLFFSLQVALAPVAVLALYDSNPSRFGYTAVGSVALACGICLTYGAWAIFSAAAVGSYHQLNITFILPVIAFAVPFAILTIHVLASSGPRGMSKWISGFAGASQG